MKKTNCELWMMLVSLLALGLVATQTAQAMSLDDFLVEVSAKHKTLKSLEASKSAAEARASSSDTDFAPALSLSGSYIDDKKTGGQPPSFTIPHQQTRYYSLGMSKKFSSGTKLGITADNTLLSQDIISSSGASSYEFGLAALGFSVQQSLWKDFFGAGSRLRLNREQTVSLAEKQTYDLQFKQLLIQAEAAYWDLVYLQDELNQRKASLERANSIEKWTQQRFSNGIGDKADVLNAQGLKASREFQLLATQDDLKTAQQKVADLLELGRDEALPRFEDDLGKARAMTSFVGGPAGGQILRLDGYLAVLDAKAKALASEEVVDAYRPDLVFAGGYKTNAFETNMSDARNKITSTDKPTQQASLTLTYLFDDGSKSDALRAAKMDALASSLKKERLLLESDSSWSELNRRYSELSKRVEAAAKINQIQSAKAGAERDKLSKGRSITSQVITAEQDAAEAGLTLTKLKAEQRKLEAQSRLYVRIQQ